jgi:hypothetical protein
MAEPVALKYRAFISYSHADTSWAKWLHCGLESFPIDKELVGRETVSASTASTSELRNAVVTAGAAVVQFTSGVPH